MNRPYVTIINGFIFRPLPHLANGLVEVDGGALDDLQAPLDTLRVVQATKAPSTVTRVASTTLRSNFILLDDLKVIFVIYQVFKKHPHHAVLLTQKCVQKKFLILDPRACRIKKHQILNKSRELRLPTFLKT
jgi:hypothetical protein